MHIRAPKSGFVDSHISSAAVQTGELLFTFDTGEEQVEVLKAELALDLLRSLRARLDSATANDRIEGILGKSSERAQANSNAYDALLRARRDQLNVGEITTTTMQQVVMLEAFARRDQALNRLGNLNIMSSFQELSVLLPLQQQYSELALQVARTNLSRMRIVSPVNGRLRDWQARGWVTRGAILASFEDA